jgi:hypothetical protein
MILTLLAAAALPVDRFVALEQAKAMVTSCAKLDPHAAPRMAKALKSAQSLSAPSAAKGQSAAQKLAQKRWQSLRKDIDTSCIVGPQETPAAAYASLLHDLEAQTKEIRQWLNTLPPKAGGGQ